MKRDILEIKNEIINDKLNPVWEISLYVNKDDEVPDKVYEFDFRGKDMKEVLKLRTINTILHEDFEKIEIAIIGQDKFGYNETCYIIKTIILEGDE